jgi:hypothetical protein
MIELPALETCATVNPWPGLRLIVQQLIQITVVDFCFRREYFL